jgi:hypothetical protein
MENIKMKRLKAASNETKLQRTVRLWLNDKGTDYDTGWQGAYRDLAYGGCSSGMVSGLIYYTDTTRFFKRHRAEISTLLKDLLSDTGSNCEQLFGDKWDADDPLAVEQYNQNLLAWFGFEETARALAETNGYND